MSNARMAMLAVYRKQNGITDDMRTSPQEMGMFSLLRKQVEENAWPGIEQDAWAQNMSRNQIEVIRGNKRSMENPNFMSFAGGYIPVTRGISTGYESPNSGPTININNDFKGNIMSDEVTTTKLFNDAAGRMANTLNEASQNRWNRY